jgi:hypothetical protein
MLSQHVEHGQGGAGSPEQRTGDCVRKYVLEFGEVGLRVHDRVAGLGAVVASSRCIIPLGNVAETRSRSPNETRLDDHLPVLRPSIG